MTEIWNKLRADRERLIGGVWTSESGSDWCQAWTDAVDEAIRVVWDTAIAEMPSPPVVALIATGGYGRKELAPYSDIDLSLVPQDETHPSLDLVTRRVFRELHDGFHQVGLKVGYNFRLIADLPGLDATSRTALIDARRVAGDLATVRRLQAHLWDDVPIGAFLLAKLDERKQSEARTHGTPFVVAPHLKEGCGGLRSAHCANWLRAAVGERTRLPSDAYDAVLQARNRLHAVAGERTDVLTRGRQADIADHLQTDVFSLLRSLWPAMSELHAEFEDTFERLRASRFHLTPNVWNYGGSVRMEPEATASEAAMALLYAVPLRLEVERFPVALRPHVQYGEAALVLRAGSPAVRLADRAGILDHLLPELTACRAVAPKDAVHDFSVFEHSVRTLEEMEAIVQRSSIWGEMHANLRDPALLHLAILLHDVGKAKDQPRHSEVGAEMVADLADRWRLDPRDRDELVWLVRHHLEMARFARMRDVHLPETAQEFAEFVGTAERLSHLALLTVADIAAVSSDSLTPVLESFLIELYQRTYAELQSEAPVDLDLSEYRRRVIRHSETKDPEALRAFVESLPAHYMAAMPIKTAERHFEILSRAQEHGLAIEFGHIEDQATEVTVCTRDVPGLLSRILGVFYALDLSLVAVRAHTTQADPPFALDVFTITFGGRALKERAAQRMIEALKSVLTEAKTVDDVLREGAKNPTRQQEIYRWTFVPGHPAIIEFQAPRGRGMAYRMSRMLARFGWNVLSARVGIWAGQGAAAFYVNAADGRELTRDEVEVALGPQV